jgi:hypothetical protein
MISFVAFCQIEFGAKIGINSLDLVANGIKINNSNRFLDINYKGATYGNHIGFYSRVSLLGIYVEPGLLLNSNNVKYTVDDYSEGGILTTIKNESYQNLDIPFMVGFKKAFTRFYAGPVAHIFISNVSDFKDLSGYEGKFKSTTYGYQAGAGVDVWKFRLDVAYEGNLSNFGDHINIGGNAYSFGQSASRILFTLGYKF